MKHGNPVLENLSHPDSPLNVRTIDNNTNEKPTLQAADSLLDLYKQWVGFWAKEELNFFWTLFRLAIFFLQSFFLGYLMRLTWCNYSNVRVISWFSWVSWRWGWSWRSMLLTSFFTATVRFAGSWSWASMFKGTMTCCFLYLFKGFMDLFKSLRCLVFLDKWVHC